MGGTDDFSTDVMAFVLSQHGVLNYEADKSEEIAENANNNMGVNNTSIRTAYHASLSDSDDDFDLDS